MIAFVRGVIAASMSAGSMLYVFGSTSTHTGVAPVKEMALELAMNEPAGVMTSSPGRMPIARMPSSSADMPESRPTQCSASQ